MAENQFPRRRTLPNGLRIILGLSGLIVLIMLAWIVLEVFRPKTPADDLSSLGPKEREQYIILIADVYAYDGDIDLAQARLSRLNDPFIKSRLAAYAKAYSAEGRNNTAAKLAMLDLAMGSDDPFLRKIASYAPDKTPTISQSHAVTLFTLTATSALSSISSTPTINAETPVARALADLRYPLRMTEDDSDIVRLQINLGSAFSPADFAPQTLPLVFSVEPNTERNSGKVLEEGLKVYPVMFAELNAPNFELSQNKGSPRRPMTGKEPIAWAWNIKATKVGLHPITINVYGEPQGENETLPVLTKSITRNIEVVHKPWFEQLLNWLESNAAGVFATIGTLVLGFLTLRSNAELKRLKEEIGGLKTRVGIVEEGHEVNKAHPKRK